MSYQKSTQDTRMDLKDTAWQTHYIWYTTKWYPQAASIILLQYLELLAKTQNLQLLAATNDQQFSEWNGFLETCWFGGFFLQFFQHFFNIFFSKYFSILFTKIILSKKKNHKNWKNGSVFTICETQKCVNTFTILYPELNLLHTSDDCRMDENKSSLRTNYWSQSVNKSRTRRSRVV